MNDKCIVKKTFFSIISFEYPVPLNMRLLMQLRSATVEKKWPVFLQNASGNLKSSTNNFQVNRASSVSQINTSVRINKTT